MTTPVPHRSSDDARPTISRWEWTIAGLGVAMFVALVGYLLWRTATRESLPPDLSIQADSIVRVSGGHLVLFTARNAGTGTAAAVRVVGTLRRDTSTVETSEVTIDYVPARSRRGGGLLFSEDPRRHTLELRPTGYQEP